MTKISFSNYLANNKNPITPDTIVIISWIVVLAIGFLSGSRPVGTWLAVCALILSTYYLVRAGFTYEPLSGVLTGETFFDNEKISTNGQSFKLTEIINIDFKIDDYYGRKIIRLYKSVNPCLSNGVDNYVKFTAVDGTDQVIYFQLKRVDDWQQLIPFINHLVEIKKMTFKDAIDLVGIENVKA